MDIKRLNDLAEAMHDGFRLSSFDGADDSLTILGSQDFCYYHNIAVRLRGVSFIRCPVRLQDARFDIQEPPSGSLLRVGIATEQGEFEILADSITIDWEVKYYPDYESPIRSTDYIVTPEGHVTKEAGHDAKS